MDEYDKDLREVCEQIRSLLAADVERIGSCRWVGATRNQRWEFVKRASFVRQFEATKAILILIDSRMGNSGVTLLRPAYEELLWMEYLNRNKEHAIELVELISKKEIFDSFSAQQEFLGAKGMRDIGFTKRRSSEIERSLGGASSELVRLGKSLGWRQGSEKPSFAFIARKLGREKQYNFLYQGTSRSVHFSPHELQRRVWGSHGEVTISSSSFSRYWSDFALSWSFRMLSELAIACEFTAELDARQDRETLLDLQRRLRPVQILTASELEAWNEPASDLWRPQ